MDHFDFWQKWLYGLGIIMVVFGLALAFLNGTVLFLVFDQNIDPVFWRGNQPPAPFVSFQGWIYAVLGATMAGWGVCVAFMAHYPLRKKEGWAWNALASAILLWAVVDTFFSVRFGVYFNALFNLLLLIMAALPLAFTRRFFSSF